MTKEDLEKIINKCCDTLYRQHNRHYFPSDATLEILQAVHLYHESEVLKLNADDLRVGSRGWYHEQEKKAQKQWEEDLKKADEFLYDNLRKKIEKLIEEKRAVFLNKTILPKDRINISVVSLDRVVAVLFENLPEDEFNKIMPYIRKLKPF